MSDTAQEMEARELEHLIEALEKRLQEIRGEQP